MIIKSKKSINVSSPLDKESEPVNIEDLLYKFEKQLARESKGLDFYHLVLFGAIDKNLCTELQNIYLNAGWSKVICKSEKGFVELLLWRHYNKEIKVNRIKLLIKALINFEDSL